MPWKDAYAQGCPFAGEHPCVGPSPTANGSAQVINALFILEKILSYFCFSKVSFCKLEHLAYLLGPFGSLEAHPQPLFPDLRAFSHPEPGSAPGSLHLHRHTALLLTQRFDPLTVASVIAQTVTVWPEGPCVELPPGPFGMAVNL